MNVLFRALKKSPWLIGGGAALALFIVGFILLGALRDLGRTTKAVPASKEGGNKNARSDLLIAIGLTRETVDLVKAQEIVKRMNNHLSADPAAKAQLEKEKVDRDLLAGRFALVEGEVGYVTGITFSSLDAFHLEWCFRLRDVADSLRLKKLPALSRAEQAFAWVMRHVVLETRGKELLPPSTVLFRGRGNAEERALVFLDFLHQLGLDGCMIALPGKEGTKHYWAAGVLIEEAKEKRIFLFDCRLGMPIPGPQGKGVATLEEIRQQPELLKALSVSTDFAYDVSAEQIAKAEVHVAPPISALSTRMKYLETQLSKHVQIRLAVSPENLLATFDKAVGRKVQVWNEKGSDPKKKPPVTAVRALPGFLPPNLGGIGNEEAYHKFAIQLIPWTLIKTRYQELGVDRELPKRARDQRDRLTKDLYYPHILVPADKLTRGRLEEMLGPLTRIDKILEELNRGKSKSEMEPAIAEWREKVDKVYSLPENSPQARNLELALWAEDQYLLYVIYPGKEQEEIPKEIPKRTLSYLVLSSTAKPLSEESTFLVARYWLEKAARSQIELSQYRAENKTPPKELVQQADDAYYNVVNWLQKYVEEHGVHPTPENLAARLQVVRKAWELGDLADLELCQQLVKDIHRTLAVRLHKIDALLAAGETQKAQASAEALATDVRALMKSSEINDLAAYYKAALKKEGLNEEQRDYHMKSLELFLGSLEPGGSCQWYGHAAALRAALVKKKQPASGDG